MVARHAPAVPQTLALNRPAESVLTSTEPHVDHLQFDWEKPWHLCRSACGWTRGWARLGRCSWGAPVGSTPGFCCRVPQHWLTSGAGSLGLVSADDDRSSADSGLTVSSKTGQPWWSWPCNRTNRCWLWPWIVQRNPMAPESYLQLTTSGFGGVNTVQARARGWIICQELPWCALCNRK